MGKYDFRRRDCEPCPPHISARLLWLYMQTHIGER